MVSFEVQGGRDGVQKFVDKSGLPFAPTLGDISTTISHPPTSSHRALSEQQRLGLGISQGFMRVSVGIEETDDLLDAFRAGLKAV